MRTLVKNLSERLVTVVLREEDAGACVPPDPWYQCTGHLKLRCSYNCKGDVYCSSTGQRC